jgi:hypothetical protein
MVGGGVATGVAPTKEPTKSYGAATKLSWELLAADVVNITIATLNLYGDRLSQSLAPAVLNISGIVVLHHSVRHL